MNNHHEKYHDPEHKRNWWRSRDGVIMLIFLVFIGFFLITEHQAHVFRALPWLIILACPFLHLFMHRGHGGHGQHDDNDDNNDGAP
jgi:quinol-cytochrome oxidoreductase complex cytochrome b subunit